MKVKCRPDDFQVEELTSVKPREGRFALYSLEKSSIGTIEAVKAIADRWRIPAVRICHGGLKDRHARTRQHVTVAGGPPRNLRQTNIRLTYLGQTERPFESADVDANRFTIVLRDMTVPEVEQAAISLEKLTRNGVPNYFDRQRFGSRGDSGEFVALPWCQGRYERALWLALTSGTPSDRPRDRSEKAVIRDHWGDWDTCLRKVSTASRRRILAHLAIRHQDFRGALARIDAEIRGLYLAAFQSHVWNRMLEKLLRETCGPECLHEVSLDDCLRPIHRSLDEGELGKLAAVSLPLPSARLHLDEGPVRRLVEDAVRDEGLELRQMRVKYPRDSFFSKGWRKAAVFPEHCQRVADDDEIYVGRRKMTLRFQLPRGSYATVLVKCVTAKPCG